MGEGGSSPAVAVKRTPAAAAQVAQFPAPSIFDDEEKESDSTGNTSISEAYTTPPSQPREKPKPKKALLPKTAGRAGGGHPDQKAGPGRASKPRGQDMKKSGLKKLGERTAKPAKEIVPPPKTSPAKFSVGPGARAPPPEDDIARNLGDKCLKTWVDQGWRVVDPPLFGTPLPARVSSSEAVKDTIEKLLDPSSWVAAFEALKASPPLLADSPWFDMDLEPMAPVAQVAVLQSLLRDLGYSFANLAHAFSKSRPDLRDIPVFAVEQEVEIVRRYLRAERDEWIGLQRESVAPPRATKPEWQRHALRSSSSVQSSPAASVLSETTVRGHTHMKMPRQPETRGRDEASALSQDLFFLWASLGMDQQPPLASPDQPSSRPRSLSQRVPDSELPRRSERLPCMPLRA